jgi:transposase
MFAGIDWASEEHAVCVVDATGRVVERFTIAHTAEGFERLVRRLAERADPAELPVAIERPDGRLVERLLLAGHPVVPVKTTAIKAWREAEVASGAKSDPGDARVIAECLRSRRQQLRQLSEETRALRAVVRTRTDLVDARIAATNQLAAILGAFWPGAGEPFDDRSSEIASPSWSATRRRPRPPASARHAWPASCAGTATAAGAARPSCSSGSARRRWVCPTGRSRRPDATRSSPWST